MVGIGWIWLEGARPPKTPWKSTQAVEPFDKAKAGLAVIEAAIESIADGTRQAGDFAFTGHKSVNELMS